MRPGSAVEGDRLDGQGDAVVRVEGVPVGREHVAGAARERQPERIAAVRRQRIAVAGVGRDAQAQAGRRQRRARRDAVRLRRVGVGGAQDADRHARGHAVHVAAQVEQAADAGRVVGGVVLALAGGEGVLEAAARRQRLDDRARLVAVADDVEVGQLQHRLVDDVGRVAELGGVDGLGAHRRPVDDEAAVPAVLAAPHDPVDLQPGRPVGAATDDQPASRVGVLAQVALQIDFGHGGQGGGGQARVGDGHGGHQ